MNSADQISCTKEELNKRAKIYLIHFYGHPKTLGTESLDKWMERYGLLLAFIDDQFHPPLDLSELKPNHVQDS